VSTSGSDGDGFRATAGHEVVEDFHGGRDAMQRNDMTIVMRKAGAILPAASSGALEVLLDPG
jgi:hypothetical protein